MHKKRSTFACNQRMNAYLKEIADVCGIAKRLTTHVARHKWEYYKNSTVYI